MRQLCRREFLSLAAAAVAAPRSAFGDADDILQHPRKTVEALERARVLSAAQRYLREPPRTIVSAPAPRSAGSLHDYFSEADYFWPDPKNPDGPYVNRDGESNPGNFNTHRLLLIHLSIQVPALAAAWMLTRHRDLAEHAAAHLRAWFIEPATRMNPNLQYAQAVHGVSMGRSWGIIDTLHFGGSGCRPPLLLHRDAALSESDWSGTQNWFNEYLAWMQTSEPGRKESDAKNNHGSCWIVQVAAFARLVGDESALACGLPRSSGELSFQRKSHRTAAFPLSLHAPSHMATLCLISMRSGWLLTSYRMNRMTCGTISSATAEGWKRVLSSWHLTFAMSTRGLFGGMSSTSTICPCANQACSLRGLRFARASASIFGGISIQIPPYPRVIRNHPIRQPLLWLR